ncbi:N-acetylgalactosamine-N,N'-diacetylbacillosaminyl-diphospho-undecaprenol 4-alpha-N-acetylgalactosaminyltransferase [Pirellula sp. SH-Sr6A]|nr:N-acetylgalactosamine-N,N'-diacetylbacillosaminyl-diphospho-undecaprenol 4-alpha-N-acetylgalactosaminyltransferase [Pirellula sp. SH-Sr6A]
MSVNPNRTRLLLCSSSMEAGGSERQMLYLMQYLDRSRFDLSLYLLYPKGSLLEEVPEDVAVYSYWGDRSPPRWNWPGRIFADQVRHLTQHLRSHPVDLVYDRLFHMALIAGPAAKRTQTPRIATLVSPPNEDVVRSEKRWLAWKKRALRRSYLSAQGLLAVGSETAASAALFYNIPRERFRIVTSPIDVKRIESSAQMPWENSSLDLRCKQVIAIGRQSDEKGHRYLIEAMALYQKFVEQGDAPPVVVHLVGDGVLRKELESLTDSLGLRGSVLFHGVQANPYSLLAKSDLMVLPSLYEGLPNVVLEAMLCRVPVLATNTPGGAGELFRRTGLGQLVARCSATEIANAMRRRFSDPDPWLAPLEAARQYILENHSMDRWIGELSDLFESLRRRGSH